MTNFDEIDGDVLRGVAGGINMKLTQYGYANDPYMDSDTRHGRGAYHRLSKDSMALTDSGLRALGLTRHDVRSGNHWVEIHLRGGGTLQRRIDDRAPERDKRADLYMPHGFDRHLGDHADVRLLR